MSISKTKGFTLLELLVVIVLLGLVYSLAVFSISSASIERELEEEAKRLHALIKLVREDAILQAREIAMEINKNSYLFLVYEDKKWLPVKEKVFRQRKIRDEFQLKVETDEKLSVFKNKKNEKLRLYFLSSGEQTPFEMKIRIKHANQPGYRLMAHFNGELVLDRIDEN